MNDDRSDEKLRKWEWLAARIVGGVALLAIIAIVAVSIIGRDRVLPPTVLAALGSAGAASGGAPDRREQGLALCHMGIGAAVAYGVLPSSTTQLPDEPKPGNVQGRYVCAANVDHARYEVTFDLVCGELKPDCINLFSVKQDDGTSLYQRQG